MSEGQKSGGSSSETDWMCPLRLQLGHRLELLFSKDFLGQGLCLQDDLLKRCFLKAQVSSYPLTGVLTFLQYGYLDRLVVSSQVCLNQNMQYGKARWMLTCLSHTITSIILYWSRTPNPNSVWGMMAQGANSSSWVSTSTILEICYLMSLPFKCLIRSSTWSRVLYVCLPSLQNNKNTNSRWGYFSYIPCIFHRFTFLRINQLFLHFQISSTKWEKLK